ncbi:hypothetical protein DSO57_1034258 [Entomophthora muscae]|uniref:Uncharacterized protein n=1 Tax=Entomophthora muscae TaxID=34485 RepID=A0ACC2RER2_9FUNG|nr:hypothetical protein DSO57_1034258 [Entomophthora muscae]
MRTPLATLIPASQVIPSPSRLLTLSDSLPTQVVSLCSLVPPQQNILLALPETLFHDVLLAQCFSSDGVVLLSKLTPEHPKEDVYVLKESIFYQNKRI